MSLDCKCMFGYHGCMMALMLLGGSLTLRAMVMVVAALLSSFAIISVVHRIRCGWRWPGVGVKNILGVGATVLLGGFFIGAVLPRATPSNPAIFPWFAAAAGIVLFGVLSNLRVVYQSEAEFLSFCGDQPPPPTEAVGDSEIAWKKTARRAYSGYFLAVWIAGVSFFRAFDSAYQNGSPKPTTERTEPLTDHGHTVYITTHEKRTVTALEYVMMIGIPSAILAGFVLQKRFGIDLNPNAGFRKRASSG